MACRSGASGIGGGRAGGGGGGGRGGRRAPNGDDDEERRRICSIAAVELFKQQEELEAANWNMEAATGEVDMEDDVIVIDDD
jgi:hypothetical protein